MTAIAARFAGLAATTLLLLAALGASNPDLQPSARIVLVTAVVGLLSPLFWPGRAGTAVANSVRIIGWSLASTAFAAAVAALSGLGLDRLPRAATALALLFLALVAVHALAATVEGLLQRRADRPEAARESAAWIATAALVTLAAAPLWLGPAAELALADRPDAVDAVVAVSPLAHLAVASGNDLLRNQWFYQHSNLAGLRFDYPPLGPVLTAYLLLAAVLLMVPVVLGPRPGSAARVTVSPVIEEHRT
jgi:hypothetical protein